jgi:NDP-sugar pyrophosphorylase family protein
VSGARVSTSEIDTAILAGGLGTRLQSVLPETPKILAPVLGRPFLDHLLDRLARQGVRRVTLCLGYRAADVLRHLEKHPYTQRERSVVIEPEPLGTAGAIALARSRLRSDPALVVNGDTIVDADLGSFVAMHRKTGADASILCVEVEDGRRYGSVEFDDRDRIVGFAEKGRAGPGWINAGYYLMGSVVMDRIASRPRGSLERDILGKMEGSTILGYRSHGRFLDIGTPDTLRIAAEFLDS